MHVLANTSVKPTECLITKNIISPMAELVLLFMMVSAFGMCCGYYERVKAGRMRPSDFYGKRYGRILPFFALVVCLDLAYAPSWDSLVEGFSDVTLVFGLCPECDIEVIGVGWFLGTIFVFYMLFPFFVFLLDDRRKAWVALSLSLAWQLSMVHYYHAAGGRQMLYSAPYFIAGGLVFLYRDDIAALFGKGASSEWMGLAGCVLLTAVFNFVPEVHQTLFGRDLPRLVLYSAWLCYAVGSSQRLLDNRITAYVSDISMEIYLCHMVLFRVVEKMHVERFVPDGDGNYVVVLSMTLAGAIMFSHAAKYWILPRIMNLVFSRNRPL